MVKIGIMGGKTEELTDLYSKKKWMNQIPKKFLIDKYFVNSEIGLVTSIEYKYPKAEVTYIKDYDEKKLQKNDINFLVGTNLLDAFHHSKEKYLERLKIVKNKKNNIYPPYAEQKFLYNKGNYLLYFQKKGIPIAPTFLVGKQRTVKNILKKVKQNKWNSFVLKPEFAYANINISKFDMNDTHLEKNLQKYLDKNEKYPGFVCQEKMIGFSKYWECKSFWLNGEYKYHIGIKASGGLWGEEEQLGTLDHKTLQNLKKMGKKVINAFPKTKINGKIVMPVYIRIDFGCCLGNTLDKTKYFLNEIEYAGSAMFVDVYPNVFHHWTEVYYNKAMEIYNLRNPLLKKKSKKIKRKSRRTRRIRRIKRTRRTRRTRKKERI